MPVIISVVVDAFAETALILCDKAPNSSDFPAFTGPINPTFSTQEFYGLFHLPL